jgi:DNA-binding NtrC family response regulator
LNRPLIPHILIVEDQATLLRAFSKMLRQQGFEVLVATSRMQVKDILAAETVSTAIISMELAEQDGLDLIKIVATENSATSILAIASSASARNTVLALEAGASDYFLRPITNWNRFYHILRNTQKLWSEQIELQKLRSKMELLRSFRSDERFSDIKGNSAIIQQLLGQIKSIAPLDVSTLILGESGVGKELVARAIHKYSNRIKGPFVSVNCAAISPELFEAELFGHQKGAFTGATQTRLGLCSAASGGTLFLDEVGELPSSLQPKLLRLLEENEFRAVGSDALQRFSGRVIAATNVDLEVAVQKRKFREDLYFRLSVQELYVPSLRERKEDIQLLSFYFIEQYNKTCRRQVHQIDSKALSILETYDWHRNNVRELEREIQRALVRSSPDATILMPDVLFVKKGKQSIPKGVDDNNDVYELTYAEALAVVRLRFMRGYVQHQIQKAGGNKSKAAKLSGMKPPNFFRLLRELDVNSKK